MNAKQRPDGPVIEYDFAKSFTLHVPGDWNTQFQSDRGTSLFAYEGLVWYERDFAFRKRPGSRVFLHIGAANYQSFVWVNTKGCLSARRGVHAVRLRDHERAKRRGQFCCDRG